ncbi:hypothetical protein QQS21_011537 [Conoideocrella luteorostrata]|uniref:Uncharacterized protein n=1 Tax=Conoideocrella luteorostrata TaxID=1105319 RepID=A0AAJ0CCY0_9HYPO|nr:hypothetical protein QQS21_011537 [Conoideocrella luteorostrata]
MLLMFLIMLVTIVGPCHGWYLDASCRSNQDDREAFVKKWMASAFELSKAASRALDELERDRSVQYRNRGEMHIARSATIETLFNSLHDLIRSPPPNSANLPPLNNPDWILVKDRFKQVNVLDSQQKEHNPTDDPAHRYLGLPSSEVIIYCDYSRFRIAEQCITRAWNPGYACDTSIGLDVKMDQAFVECQDSLNSPTLEIAWSQPATLFGMPYPLPPVQMPAQIQICPGHLRDALYQRPIRRGVPFFQVIEELRDQVARNPGALNRRFKAKFKFKFPAKSGNDLVMLGDGRMLYSLLSTLLNGPGGVDGPNSLGFDNCVRLSGDKERKDDGTDRSRALDNTENYVFFAINCALIDAPPGKSRIAILRGQLGRLTRQGATSTAETE